MKKLIVQFLIAMTIVSVLYTLFLKSRRERIARINEVVFASDQRSQKTGSADHAGSSLSPKGLVATTKENAEALQSGMTERYEQAKSALDLGKEPPAPTLLSEQMQRKKKKAWKRSGGDSVIDQLLNNVRSTAIAYEQSAAARCNKARKVSEGSK